MVRILLRDEAGYRLWLMQEVLTGASQNPQ